MGQTVLEKQIAEAIGYLEDRCSWWRLEMESDTCYRILAAAGEWTDLPEITQDEKLAIPEYRVHCIEEETLEALLQRIIDHGLPWDMERYRG